MLKDLVLKNRSYRRFHQDKTIELEILRELIDLAGLSASGANRQALKYILSNNPQGNVDEVKAKLDAGANIVIVDSPSQADYDQSHIAGAVSIPLVDMLVNMA